VPAPGLAVAARLRTIGPVRRLLPVCIALGLAVAVSSCDVSLTSYAARVDGTTVANSELTDVLQAATTNAAFHCIELAKSSSGTIEGTASGSFSAVYAANRLTGIIEAKLVHTAIGRLGLQTTPLASSIANDELTQSFSPPSGSSCSASGTAVLDSLPASLRTEFLGDEADEVVLAAHLAGYPLTPAGVAAYGAKHGAALELACVSAILVANKSSAVALRAAILGGASFAVVAKANSIDAASAPNGGAVGCHAPSDFTSPLGATVAKLKVGELSEVLAFGSSYVILEVTGHEPASSTSVAEALVAAGITAENAYITKLAGTAHVDVDATYGVWGRAGGTWAVLPPNGPADAMLPNPAALTPAVVVSGNS